MEKPSKPSSPTYMPESAMPSKQRSKALLAKHLRELRKLQAVDGLRPIAGSQVELKEPPEE